jgi:hypothetical protein
VGRSGIAPHQKHAAFPGEPHNLNGDELLARQLRDGAAPWQQSDSKIHFDRSLDSVKTRQGHHHPQREVSSFE